MTLHTQWNAGSLLKLFQISFSVREDTEEQMVGMYATSNGIYSTSIVEFDTFTLVYGDIFKTSN